MVWYGYGLLASASAHVLRGCVRGHGHVLCFACSNYSPPALNLLLMPMSHMRNDSYALINSKDTPSLEDLSHSKNEMIVMTIVILIACTTWWLWIPR